MRWGKAVRLSKKERRARWHFKFLWTPHMIEDQWVWLERVQRKSRRTDPSWGSDGVWLHEYRFPVLFKLSVPFDRYPEGIFSTPIIDTAQFPDHPTLKYRGHAVQRDELLGPEVEHHQ